jgi:hypothetical protein
MLELSAIFEKYIYSSLYENFGALFIKHTASLTYLTQLFQGRTLAAIICFQDGHMQLQIKKIPCTH